MYKMKNTRLGRILSCVLTVAMLLSMTAVSAYAADTLTAGNYSVDATLSCYVNAMGGVEFSDGYGLLKDAAVEVDEEGNAALTMNLGMTSGLSIYGVACTAFIGVDEAPGYYADGAVTKEGVTYTTSTGAVNANGDASYITSITMPVNQQTSEYTLWLYLDSNVMGCQLGDGSGTGASNTPGVATKHTAKLTIDWDSLAKDAAETSAQSATVEYTVLGAYEVEIPSTITVDPATKTGSYAVVAKDFTIAEGAYVTVTADESGKLTSTKSCVAFTNTLEEGKLQKTGDTLAGTVKVTTENVASGSYKGTINFTIKYFE